MKYSKKMCFEADFVKSKDFDKEFKKFNLSFLKLLFDKIDKNNITIADYGGGRGILTNDIVKLCKNREIITTIENIDMSAKKLKGCKNVNYVKKDALKYRSKNKYDFAVCRYLLHFYNNKNNLKLLRNIYYNLKPGGYFLFINWVIDDPKTNRLKRSVFDLIGSYKGIVRPTIPTSKYMKNLCRKVGFKIADYKKHDYCLYINDFYKNRFNLSADQVKQIENKMGIKFHKQSQTGILLRKV
jgi:SAM-dependent methyltransferase